MATSTVIRLVLAAMVGPGNDEAYYCLFADHLDWSYFDHPPLVGWMAALGRWMTGGSRSILSHRLPFLAMFAGSTLLIAEIASRLHGGRSGPVAAFLLNAAAYPGMAVGSFVLPDGPLLFFWLLTLLAFLLALDRPDARWRWLFLGMAWGGALLSKYHAVFLPVAAMLYLLLTPEKRSILRRPGPYLALGVGLLLFMPVVVWNIEQTGASFKFQGRRAVGFGIHPESAAAALLGQMLYLSPWIGFPLLIRLVRMTRAILRSGGTSVEPANRLQWAFAVGPVLFFAVVSFLRPVFPHWGLIGFVSLIPGLAHDWDQVWRRLPDVGRIRVAGLATAPMVLVGLLVAQTHVGLLDPLTKAVGGRINGRTDPTVDLASWSQIAEELQRRGLADPHENFLFTGHWYNSGQLAFAMPPGVDVLCYSTDSRSFGLWSPSTAWVGKTGILVAADDRSAEPGCFESYFDRIRPLGSILVHRNGRIVRSVRLFECKRQILPFPFQGSEESDLTKSETPTSLVHGSPAPSRPRLVR